jgi:hypothetical protein
MTCLKKKTHHYPIIQVSIINQEQNEDIFILIYISYITRFKYLFQNFELSSRHRALWVVLPSSLSFDYGHEEHRTHLVASLVIYENDLTHSSWREERHVINHESLTMTYTETWRWAASLREQSSCVGDGRGLGT